MDRTHVGWTSPATPPRALTQADVDAVAAVLGVPASPVPTAVLALVATPAWRAVLESDELGLALARAVHVEQQEIHLRPVIVGDVLTAQARVTRVRPRETSDWVTVTVTIESEHERVAMLTSTFVVAHESPREES